MSETNLRAITPKQRGFTFPAEWAPHSGTWLSWIHKEESWPGKLEAAYPAYCAFIGLLSWHEEVHLNVRDALMEADARKRLKEKDVNWQHIHFHHFETNDAWCRDHGPAFLVNPETRQRAVVDWDYNAWGGKYPPFDKDDVIPTQIGQLLGLEVFYPGIIMEGGSVEFNGQGTVLTTTACLLNPNRNPGLTQEQIEWYLKEYYGQEQVLWLNDGIVGDDTDGHIDDLVRFVNHNTVVTVVEQNEEDENYTILQENLEMLRRFRLPSGEPLQIVPLPMPRPVVWEDQRLPASYANFYIGNGAVYVPTFRDDAHDNQALATLKKCFPDRKIYGIDSTDLIWGLGSFHCLSQQEPL